MTHHLIPQTTYFDTSGYRAPWRAREDQLPIRCDHEPVDRFLCPDCTALFRAVLADVPALVYDLTLAVTRQTSFVDHGTHVDESEGERESPLPYDQAASAATDRLARVLGAPRGLPGPVIAAADDLRRRMLTLLLDPTVPSLAAQVSSAALHARKIIDRPPDPWYFGACPNGHDIYADRDITHITCSRCDYAAPIADHQLACLNAGDNRMLTVTELVGAITSAGETVTRHQINGWIKREGLAREIDNRASWRKGKLVSHEVYVYRLGDVRRLALRAEHGRVVLR